MEPTHWNPNIDAHNGHPKNVPKNHIVGYATTNPVCQRKKYNRNSFIHEIYEKR